ncbi:MAG: hypothetical protein KI785_05765 [Devosiaceae bacterium]|nr:hypothetical protein [Devosiaceae bacterium MH13]
MSLVDNPMCYPPRSRVRDHASGHWPVPKETWPSRLARYALAGAYALKPSYIASLPGVALMTAGALAGRRTENPPLPDPEDRLPGKECIVGVLKSTDPQHMADGFRRGMHLSGHVMPPKWLSPRDRCILLPKKLHIEKNLARLLRKDRYRLTFDRDPLGVLLGCAAPRERRLPLTWLHPPMIELMLKLYDAHVMHSLEVWDENGDLVGGLFGYVANDLFMVESQFHTVRDTSKIAVVGLVAHLDHWDFTGTDGGFMTPYLQRFGFQAFTRGGMAAIQGRKPVAPWGRWRFDDGLDLGHWNPAEGPCPRKPSADA